MTGSPRTGRRGGYTSPNPKRDLEIVDLVIEKGVAMDQVASTMEITPNRVYQIIGKASHRVEIMMFLYDRVTERFTSKEIAQALRVDINKVQFAIDTLTKRGRAEFSRVKSSPDSGGHTMMTEIHLTKAGIDEARKLSTRGAEAKVKKTNGSPTLEQEAAVEGFSTGWSTQAVADAKLDDVERREGAHTAKPSEKVEVEAEKTAPIVELPITEIPRYPLIAGLTVRDERLQSAAKLIDSAGQQYADLALSVLQRLDDFTPLEREVLAYVKAHTEKDKE